LTGEHTQAYFSKALKRFITSVADVAVVTVAAADTVVVVVEDPML
jgi:hypothetical protein